MLVKAAQEFDELCEIEDMSERAKIACEKFSNGEISAKALRLLYNILDLDNKMILIDSIYDETNNPKALENMRRCPPDIMFQGFNKVSVGIQPLIRKLATYKFIYQYKISKEKSKTLRFEQAFAITYVPGFDFLNYGYEIKRARILALKKLVSKDQEHDTSPLNLPTNLTFGCELEFVGITLKKLKEVIVCSGMGHLFFDWRIKKDGSVLIEKKDKSGKVSVISRGAECVSPILEDTKKSWEDLDTLCSFIRILGGRANASCGGHIHFGKDVLGFDTKAWETFFTIWREVEPIMYIITNRRGESSRARIGKYASGIEEKIDNNLSSISIKNQAELQEFAKRISDKDRYKGINLINIASETSKKDTIEFRLPNGTIDYNIIRENVLLYGRLLQVAKMRSVDPTIKQKEYDLFMERDLPEEEKVKRLLDLVFFDEKEKDIFYKRWEYNVGRTENIKVSDRRYIKQYDPKVIKTGKKSLNKEQAKPVEKSTDENEQALEPKMEAFIPENNGTILEQIRELLNVVEPQKQMEVMEAMIAELNQATEISGD